MDNLSKTLFPSEFAAIAPAPPLDAVEPLPCDRWLAASALQKAIRRGDALTAQRAARTLYRHDPRSAWRRLLVIAYEDIGIGALGAVISTTLRSANAKARREAGGDEAAALATSQMLAAAPKDRSADLLFAIVLHDPALENARSMCRSVSVARRLEFVADPTLSLPERALAAWHSSGVEERGERRVGPGDLGGLMRTYAELGVPERLLEAVGFALKKTRGPFVLMLPLLWLAAAEGEAELVELSAPAVRSDQRRPTLRPRQAHPSRAASHRTLRSRERRDRAVSERACAGLPRGGAGHGGLLCRQRADPAHFAMATLGRAHGRRRRRRFPQGQCRRERRRRIDPAR